MEAKIKIRKVTELDEEFHIPNYQRGYKWRKKDVEYLLSARGLTDTINIHLKGIEIYYNRYKK